MKWIEKLPRWTWWGLVLPLLALNAWVALLFYQYFEGLIKISVAAALLAFILGYPVGLIQRLRLSRTQSIFGVLILVVAAIAILGVTIIPILLEQTNELITKLPSWLDSGFTQLDALQVWVAQRNFPFDLGKLADQFEPRLTGKVQEFSGAVLGLLPDAISSLLDFALTLVLTFYLLLHGERLWDGVFQWLPERINGKIRPLLSENFHNYFAGQLTLGLLMGTTMTIAFVMIQVPFGLLFGIGVGLLAVFPFGTATGLIIVSFLTALKSIWLGVRVLAVGAVIAQVVDSAIAPLLIGGFTGLNPVWILISLLVGAKMAGVLGLVIAVPIASSFKALLAMIRAGELGSDDPDAGLVEGAGGDGLGGDLDGDLDGDLGDELSERSQAEVTAFSGAPK